MLFPTRCSHCPESSPKWPSCFSPLALQWFMNTVQTHFFVLQLPELDRSGLLNSWQFTNQPASYALFLILPFFVFPLCAHTHLVRNIFYAAPSVWNSLPCQIRSSNTFTPFKSSLKSHLFMLFYCLSLCARARACVCVFAEVCFDCILFFTL